MRYRCVWWLSFTALFSVATLGAAGQTAASRAGREIAKDAPVADAV